MRLLSTGILTASLAWPVLAASGPDSEWMPPRNQSGEEIQLWPERGFVPYDFYEGWPFDPRIDVLSRYERLQIESAILEWNQTNAVHLVWLGGLDALRWSRQYSRSPVIELHRVRFTRLPADVCGGSSAIGLLRRDEYGNYMDTQYVNISSACRGEELYKVSLHEIGHVLGMIHEHQRRDRELYVRISYDNPANPHPSATDTFELPLDSPPYNYRSIMHYSERWMANVGASVETIPPGIPIPTSRISPGDVDRLYWLYRKQGVDPMKETVIDTNPSGLEIIVDGEQYRTPARFRWTEGDGPYRIEAPAVQTDRQGREWRFARWNTDRTPFGSPAKSVTVRWGLAWHEANYALSD